MYIHDLLAHQRAARLRRFDPPAGRGGGDRLDHAGVAGKARHDTVRGSATCAAAAG
jgi:hypothetical protein